ncbi:twin-arginine translocation pathway signal [Halomonas sp. 1513]|nr:twin-arginine translocation pathway signal [Halomonas sp. 1513]APX93047.1 twin-arginine translocation pathway signal [Halomonas sp. 1513]
MPDQHNPQRRRFLRVMGIGGAAAGTAAVIGNVTLVQADKPASEQQDTSLNYRETDHIRAFYATLRD